VKELAAQLTAASIPEGTILPGVPSVDSRGELKRLKAVSKRELERTYHGAALYAHYFYDVLGVFRSLVDKMVDIGNTDMTFNVSSEDDEERTKHRDLARWWCDNINKDIALATNSPFGAFSINGAGIFNGFLEGMLVVHWERKLVSREKPAGYADVLVFPDFPLEGVYELPMRMYVYPGVKVRLDSFRKTRTGKPMTSKGKPVKATKVTDPEYIMVAVTDEVYESYHKENAYSSVYSFFEYQDPYSMKTSKVFAIPYDRSLAWKFYPQYNESPYPSLPVRSMFGDLEELKALEGLDKSTIESFIRQLLVIKCGTQWRETIPDQVDENGNIVKKGDIGNAQAALSKLAAVGGLIIPGHWSIDKLDTADATVLSFEKFVGPLLKLYISFGILLSYSRDNARSEGEVAFDVQGYKDRIRSFRTHGRVGGMKRFWQSLWSYEVIGREVNQAQGIRLPLSVDFEPMTLNASQLLRELNDVYMQGLVSGDYYLEALGIDSRTQRAMLNEEDHPWGEPRISYKQTVVLPDGGSKDVGITKDQQKGRPPENKDTVDGEEVL